MKKGVDYPGVTVVFICHDGNGEYVLSKRSVNCRDEHGRWDCGGGGLELHDSIIETLQKEIKEELGSTVLAHEFLGYRDVHREHDGAKTHWVALDFKVLVDRPSVRNAEPHKFDDVAWFPLSGFPEPLHSQFPNFLELYRSRL